jgi:hypothetical protein
MIEPAFGGRATPGQFEAAISGLPCIEGERIGN